MAGPWLNQIEKLWPVVRQDHSDESADTSTFRVQLIEAVRDDIEPYLVACPPDRDAVYQVPHRIGRHSRGRRSVNGHYCKPLMESTDDEK